MKTQIKYRYLPLTLLVLVLGLLYLFVPTSKVSAAGTCYLNIGPLVVSASTSTCTADQSGRKVYLNTAGTLIQPDNAANCYAGTESGAGGSFATITYQQYPCADLEALRTARRQNLCAASGGSWTTYSGGGAPTVGCSCGTGRVLSPTTSECGAIVANPDGGATDESSIATVNGPEVDCVSEGGTGDLDGENCKIVGLLNTVFNLVSGGIALAVIGNIIVAGIQYSTAQGDPSAAGKAKNRIRGALIAFLMYLGLYAFLQWLIPGGVF